MHSNMHPVVLLLSLQATWASMRLHGQLSGHRRMSITGACRGRGRDPVRASWGSPCRPCRLPRWHPVAVTGGSALSHPPTAPAPHHCHVIPLLQHKTCAKRRQQFLLNQVETCLQVETGSSGRAHQAGCLRRSCESINLDHGWLPHKRPKCVHYSSCRHPYSAPSPC